MATQKTVEQFPFYKRGERRKKLKIKIERVVIFQARLKQHTFPQYLNVPINIFLLT